MMEYGSKNRIRELRKLHKMSGEKLAQAVGLTTSHLYDIEKGNKSLNAEKALRLADALGVSVDYLLCREKPGDSFDNEIEFIKKLNLNDTELLSQFTFELDGVPISDDEALGLIAYLRAFRNMKNK